MHIEHILAQENYIPCSCPDCLEEPMVCCLYCGKEMQMNSQDYHYDHYISKKNGGSNGWDNLVIACVRCNLRKGAMNGDEFLELIKMEKEAERLLYEA